VLFFVFLAGFTWKCLWDAIVAQRVKTALDLDVLWHAFLGNELLLLVYMTVMPFLGLVIPVKWKETI
ncbi:hypothetical protein LLG96_08250, partial [bacterium]|nr:hypothetical protein [bacterium]